MKSINGREGIRGSVYVDGNQLKALRGAVGWTQEQAAAKAGYTDRLIRKLERGGPVSLQTVEDVLEAYADQLPPSQTPRPQQILVPHPPSEIERLTRLWFERAYIQRDLSIVEELMHPDVVIFSEGVSRRGREFLAQRVSQVLTGFNPIHLTVDNVFVEKDQAVAHWSVVKTHVGEFLGIAPTGKTVQLGGSSWARYENGLIVEVRDHWDIQDLVQKLTGNPSRPV